MRDGNLAPVLGGALIGTLGGLIGLGGAEFRLPLLIGVFRFSALPAVILNKAMSLVVVASALPFRTAAVPLDSVVGHWTVILNLLAGSLAGAWVGAGWALRMGGQQLYRVISTLLLVIAMVLLLGHGGEGGSLSVMAGWQPGSVAQILAGIAAGFAIGVVASLLGVAGGELLIPTLVLLFGIDVKLAGSLSLAVSLPTMLVGFGRYASDSSFSVLTENRRFVFLMAAGSLAGAFLGGQLLGIVSDTILLPALAAILVLSAAKLWRHR